MSSLIATTSDLSDAGILSPLDLDTLGIPLAPEEHLFDLDVPAALDSLYTLNHFTSISPGVEDQVALQRVHKPTEPAPICCANFTPFARSRLEYAMDRFKSAPQMMVMTNSTLWCHAMLYDEHMPRPLQAAHGGCALYEARNDTNTRSVDRHITNRVNELVATPLPTTPIEILARAHALILYQIMALFSNKVQLSMHTSALMPHLSEIGSLLLHLSTQQLDPTHTLSLYPSATAQAAWSAYIFRESLRRTILSLFQLLALCDVLCGRTGSCADGLAQVSKITLSAHLWRAQSAFDFAIAWNEKRHFLLHGLDFSEFLREAEPDDVDDFGKTMLVGLRGVDDVRGWFYVRGGTF